MDRERYEVLDVIGSGGMAIVWRARDTLLGRLVAIKRPNPATDASMATAQFAREARAAATVTHPNLVAIHDVGVDEAGPYLVMELIDGPSLATAAVSGDRVARIGMEIASALAALHAAGVVHRDVKPGNILLTPNGAKLTDFGIAHADHDTATLSQPGLMFGTPAYAAPETVAKGERSAASDVYSLAVTLHELLTGSRLNPAAGSTQAMPPGEWARVLAPALSERPSDRPTAAAFAASLATLDTRASTAVPTTPMLTLTATTRDTARVPTIGGAPRARRLAIGMFLGGVLLLSLLAALASRNDDDTADDPSGPIVSPDAAAVTGVPSTAAAATIPPSTPPSTPATTFSPTASAAPTTQPDPGSTSDPVSELIALIDGVPPTQLKPKDANDIIKRIEEVVDVGSRDPGEAEKKLREAAEQISKNLSDSATRFRAEELLIDLADNLGLPATTVTDAFEGDG